MPATDSLRLRDQTSNRAFSANFSRRSMQFVHLLFTWLLLATAKRPSSAGAGVSDLLAPALYLDLSPSPYFNQPPPPDQNEDGASAVKTLIPLAADSEHVFTRETYSATVICNATYPITWVFQNTEQNGHASWLVTLRMRRDAKIIYDTSTYSYTAELGFTDGYNRLTGNYSCKSTTRQQLRNSVFVYWEGSSPPYLLQAGENRSVCIEKGMAVLPCAVSRPQESVVLWKSTDKGYLHLRQNSSIIFDPKVGVTMYQRNLPDLVGDYVCTTSTEGEPTGQGVTVANPISSRDYVNVKVEQCVETFFMIDPNKSNATLTYDSAKGDLVCCSSSGRAPKMFHAYCHHPVICAFRQEMDADVLKRISLRRRKTKSGCSRYKIYVHSPGIVRCIGDGIDRFMEYSFPIIGDYNFGRNVSHVPIYFNWNEIQPTEMMTIQPTPVLRLGIGRRRRGKVLSSPPVDMNDIGTIYDGQWLQLFCHTSAYYFADGIQWAIKYKNNTQRFIIASVQDETDVRGYRYSVFAQNGPQSLLLQVHQDMESAICIAPVWNSTEYVHKALHLYVNQSVPPTLIDPDHEVLTWVLNDTDKEMTCGAKGVPLPEISWTFSTDSGYLGAKYIDLLNTSYTDDLDNKTHVISETVTVARVSYSTAGVYNCTVTNYGGTVYKLVTVNVEEPYSWKTFTVAIVGVVLITGLVAGIGLLVWRLRVEKRAVQNLAAISYQDAVARRVSETNPNYEDVDNGGSVSIQDAIVARAMEAKRHVPARAEHGPRVDNPGLGSVNPAVLIFDDSLDFNELN